MLPVHMVSSGLFCVAAASLRLAPAPFARAQAGEGAQPAPLYLSLRTFKNAGGLPEEGRDKNLNEQFAGGLRDYLADAAKKNNRLSCRPRREIAPAKKRPRFVP